MRLARWLLALALMVMGFCPAMAAPVGTWEIETRDSRYQVTLCGDGTQLCAELIWLGQYADTDQNRAYLHTQMLAEAPMVRSNQWRGEVNVYGNKATGTITQIAEDVVELKGCILFVICRTYRMYKIAE